MAWADAHFRRTGEWPAQGSGPVAGAPDGETWKGIDSALRKGNRGLSGGNSLRLLLVEHRGLKRKANGKE